MNIGRVVQVIGPVVDVAFDEQKLPPIYTAIRITSEGFDVPNPIDVIAEVQQHLGEGQVRAVSMQPTDGMVRGMKAADTGAPISVPVGREMLGRIVNVIGQPRRRERAYWRRQKAIRFIVRPPCLKTRIPIWRCLRPVSK